MKESEENLELFRATVAAGANALKVGMLINGGASISLLTFIGNLSKNSSEKVHLFSYGLFWFSLGIVIAAFAAGTVYFVQAYFQERDNDRGRNFNMAAVILVFLSYVFFCLGVVTSYDAFLKF